MSLTCNAVVFRDNIYTIEEASQYIREIDLILGSARFVEVEDTNIFRRRFEDRRVEGVHFKEYQGEKVVFDNKIYLLLEPPRPVMIDGLTLFYVAPAIDENEDEAHISWELNHFGCLDLINGKPPYNIDQPSDIFF